MKKILNVCMCGLIAAAIVTGCSKKPAAETTAAPESTKATESSAQETVPSVDLSTVDNGTITLGNYMGIEVKRDAVEVTDEEVQQAIDSDLAAHEKRCRSRSCGTVWRCGKY